VCLCLCLCTYLFLHSTIYFIQFSH
jgi:hypothetical protein